MHKNVNGYFCLRSSYCRRCVALPSELSSHGQKKMYATVRAAAATCPADWCVSWIDEKFTHRTPASCSVLLFRDFFTSNWNSFVKFGITVGYVWVSEWVSKRMSEWVSEWVGVCVVHRFWNIVVIDQKHRCITKCKQRKINSYSRHFRLKLLGVVIGLTLKWANKCKRWNKNRSLFFFLSSHADWMSLIVVKNEMFEKWFWIFSNRDFRHKYNCRWMAND